MILVFSVEIFIFSLYNISHYDFTHSIYSFSFYVALLYIIFTILFLHRLYNPKRRENSTGDLKYETVAEEFKFVFKGLNDYPQNRFHFI